MRHRRFVHSIGAALLLLQAAGADAPATAPATAPTTQPAATQPNETERMTLTPALADHESLKIKLLPDYAEQKKGNAAILYMEATSHLGMAEVIGNEKATKFWRQYNHLLWDVPMEKWPLKEAEDMLGLYSDLLDKTAVAAHCDHADWGTSFRERGYYAGTPYWGEMQSLSHLVTFKARLQLLRSDWKGAEQTLQVAFADSMHLGEGPTLIDQESASGGAQRDLGLGVECWIGRPHSPNLYWALTRLPSPMFPRRDPSVETAVLCFTHPEIGVALNGEVVESGWRTVIAELIADAHRFDAQPPGDPDALAGKLIESSAGRARSHLIDWGMKPPAVDGLSRDTIVGLYFVQEYSHVFDAVMKSYGLPQEQALREFEAAWDRQSAKEPHLADNPLIALIFDPEYVTKYKASHLRTWYYIRESAAPDEYIAMYRTIEAIRDYAARHEGKPPETLEQITDLPLPLEPFTNKPFEYVLKEKTAILRPVQRYHYVHTYELTFK